MFLLCGDFTERNRNLLGLPLGAWALYFPLYFPHGSLGSNLRVDLCVDGMTSNQEAMVAETLDKVWDMLLLKFPDRTESHGSHPQLPKLQLPGYTTKAGRHALEITYTVPCLLASHTGCWQCHRRASKAAWNNWWSAFTKTFTSLSAWSSGQSTSKHMSAPMAWEDERSSFHFKSSLYSRDFLLARCIAECTFWNRRCTLMRQVSFICTDVVQCVKLARSLSRTRTSVWKAHKASYSSRRWKGSRTWSVQYTAASECERNISSWLEKGFRLCSCSLAEFMSTVSCARSVWIVFKSWHDFGIKPLYGVFPGSSIWPLDVFGTAALEISCLCFSCQSWL